jgi:hypothetical protein
MALMTCKSCGHYYVTMESAPPALRCHPCDERRRLSPLSEVRRYLRSLCAGTAARTRRTSG